MKEKPGDEPGLPCGITLHCVALSECNSQSPLDFSRNLVMEQLIKDGQVRRGQLGVIVQPVTSDIAGRIGLVEARGVIVRHAQPGSAADRAGLRQGDVITALNSQPVSDSNALRNRIASTAPGTEVTLTIIRDNREQQLRATLGELGRAAGQ